MNNSPNPAASEHLPPFITAPGETDILMIVMAVFLVAAVFAVGVLFLRLHHLPEHIAHKSQKVQYQIVAVLGLLAMFTHVNLFWVAALLLALIDIPDFGGLLARMARALEKMAGIHPVESTSAAPEKRIEATPKVAPVLYHRSDGAAAPEEAMIPVDEGALPKLRAGNPNA